MIFTELRFFGFFGIVFGLYWALASNRLRKLLLLVASYVFYGAWDYRFLALLAFSTTVDYALGRVLANPANPNRPRWVVVSVLVNLTILGFFKYYGFFAESLVSLAATFGVELKPRVLSVVLPAGISFYTFQSMSYTIDVYRGHPPAKSFLDFAAFVAFFPQLVAGPIVRATNFLPQFAEPKRFESVDVRGALVTFLIGFVKKAVIADNLAPIVDRYFAAPETYDAQAAWIAVLFYAVQIYCDFSGYTDMAIASARLLGFELVKNFDFPYLASSVTDFWRRWHMSLSTWLRDYLYVPLGGSRNGRFATYKNLFLTMLLGGLWHGAAWHFVVWGALHGAALAVERALSLGPRREKGHIDPRFPLARLKFLGGVAVTFYFTCICWIFFRASDFGSALVALRSFVLFDSPGRLTFPAELFVVFGVLALLHCGFRALGERNWWRSVPRLAFAPLYGVAFALSVTCIPLEERPFIYFQF